MRRLLIAAAWTGVLSLCCLAQDPAAVTSTSGKSTTVIGCLSGPDADDHYTLTSMQHRTGVEVVGGDELKKGVGAKVKLTGTWEALPGIEAEKGDAAQRFKATAVSVMEDRCQPPSPTTPVSKKKAEK